MDVPNKTARWFRIEGSPRTQVQDRLGQKWDAKAIAIPINLGTGGRVFKRLVVGLAYKQARVDQFPNRQAVQDRQVMLPL